jgi:hypothetical protein
MTAGRVDFDDLPPETQKKIRAGAPKFKRPRETTFSKNDVRSYAMKAMGVLAPLTPSERARVLKLALEINKV